MKKTFFLVSIILFSSLSKAQSKENKWVVGISSSLVIFDKKDRDNVRDGHNFQFPKINVARYLSSGLSLDASMTLGMFDIEPIVRNPFDYFSLDGTLRYDFNSSENNFTYYVGLGGSIVFPPSTIQNSKSSGTLNLTFGSTLWLGNQWGLNFQSVYKRSFEPGQGMVSHIQIAMGIVYSLSPKYFKPRSWSDRRGEY